MITPKDPCTKVLAPKLWHHEGRRNLYEVGHSGNMSWRCLFGEVLGPQLLFDSLFPTWYGLSSFALPHAQHQDMLLHPSTKAMRPTETEVSKSQLKPPFHLLKSIILGILSMREQQLISRLFPNMKEVWEGMLCHLQS